MARVTEIRFRLNDQDRAESVHAGESLLETLRLRCGIKSTKDGCQPKAQCSCCLALVDGSLKTISAVPAEMAEGKSIVTLEGFPESDRELIARSFVAVAACSAASAFPVLRYGRGICSTASRIRRASRTRALSGHPCQCTRFTKILDAVEPRCRSEREVISR